MRFDFETREEPVYDRRLRHRLVRGEEVQGSWHSLGAGLLIFDISGIIHIV